MFGASNFPAIIAALTFALVILSIALNWLDLAVAGLLGAVFLRALGIVSQETAVSSINAGFDTIGLFFGGMVVARALVQPVFSTISALGCCNWSAETVACCYSR
jgi:Na+/H+ antiporter NhaD/arsenite permease-like protein